MTRFEVMRRYPRVVAPVIADSLGYATPGLAAQIVGDAALGKSNWCEWIASCYGGDARRAVRRAIHDRHYHRGFMTDYRQALALVEEAVKNGREPLFASWF